MTGSLDNNIIRSFRAQFELNCVRLLLESHTELLLSGTNFSDSDENAITAQLIGLMIKNPVSSDYKIDITREHYLDSDAVYAGQEDPDSSPRIDIRLMTWTSPVRFEYFLEAKNLYENDFYKTGNKTATNAGYYHKRYISTGIQNFIDRKYPNGCLVGYILEGDTEKIVDKINILLSSTNRSNEFLGKTKTHRPGQFTYSSTHTSRNLSILNHHFLHFS